MQSVHAAPRSLNDFFKNIYIHSVNQQKLHFRTLRGRNVTQMQQIWSSNLKINFYYTYIVSFGLFYVYIFMKYFENLIIYFIFKFVINIFT